MNKIVAIILSVFSFQSFSQGISGVCINGNAQPIPFVTILNIRTQNSCYTDEDGKFSIDPKGVSTSDTLLFSHLGYEDVKMSIAKIKDLKTPVELTPINYQLPEVVVKPSDAKDIIRDALSRIGDNYPMDFTMNHTIYKDLLKMDDSIKLYYDFDYDLYLPSYFPKDSHYIYTTDIHHQMYTYEGRYIPGKSLGYVAVLLRQMYPANILDTSQLDDRSFAILSRSAMIDSEEYTVIHFRKKPVSFAKHIIMEGTIYINNMDKGIRFAETHVYLDRTSHAKVIVKIDAVNNNQEIAFRKVEGKYVLDYITNSASNQSKALGMRTNQFRTTSIHVLERKIKLKMDEIPKRKEVDDILTKEKPKDTKLMKDIPDLD